MLSPFAQAAAGLAATLQGVAGVAVVYRRGERAIPLVAVRGGRTVSATGEPVATSSDAIDWLVTAAELADGNESLTPAAGDRIWEPRGVKTAVWEVMVPDDGGPVYRASDAGGVVLRIHTRLVETL